MSTLPASRRTTRDIERHYFEQFRGAYGLPEGSIEYEDKPVWGCPGYPESDSLGAQ
jgi:hypothetical protein